MPSALCAALSGETIAMSPMPISRTASRAMSQTATGLPR